MDATDLVNLLQEAVPGAQCEASRSVDVQTTLYVSRDHLPNVLRTLRERADLGFSFLAELTAVDFWPREPRFELVYMLVAIEHRRRLRVKVRLSGHDARIMTMSGIWPAANWLEREVWDLFGIEFHGHPDPRRLLMPDDWEGFPLRKDYPVQINQRTPTTQPVQVTEEEFRASLARDRLVRQP